MDRLIVMLLLLLPILLLTAALLHHKHRLGLDSMAEAGPYLLARLLPAREPDPARLLGVLVRKAGNVSTALPSGFVSACRNLRVRLSPADGAAVEATYTYALVGDELVRSYLEQAARRGWKVPAGGVQIRFEIDPHLPVGWVKVDDRAVTATVPGRWDDLAQRLAAQQSSPAELLEPVTTAPLNAGAHIGEQRSTDTLPMTRKLDRTPPRPAGEDGFVLLDLHGQAVALTAGTSLRIGRADDNDLLLSDERVSRYHAQLDVHEDRLHLSDLGSVNGTWVCGTRLIGVCELTGGETLSFGTAAHSAANSVAEQPSLRVSYRGKTRRLASS